MDFNMKVLSRLGLITIMLFSAIYVSASAPGNFQANPSGTSVSFTWLPVSPTDDVDGQQEPFNKYSLRHWAPENGGGSTYWHVSSNRLVTSYTLNDLSTGEHRFQLIATYAEDLDQDYTKRYSELLTVDIALQPVTFSIDNAAVEEGGVLTFTVTKSRTASEIHSVSYSTTNGSADGADYISQSGTLTFSGSETSKIISITTIEDAISEYDERLYVNLSSPTNGALLEDSQGYGTIQNDEPPLPPSMEEFLDNAPPALSTTGNFEVKARWDSDATNGSNMPTSVEFERQKDSGAWQAIATKSWSSSHTVTYVESLGVNGQYIYRARACRSVGCSNWENSQAVQVAIENPSFSIQNTSVSEGGSLVFNVIKSGNATQNYSVNYVTVSGTADNSDYTHQAGILTFTSSQTSKTIIVPTVDDSLAESNEILYVNLSGAVTPVVITDAQGMGTITDNDQSIVGNLPLVGEDPLDEGVAGSEYKGQLRGEHSVSKDGSFAYRIGIQVPPGINGMQPELYIGYSSNGRNGPVGWGWTIEGISAITRCPASLARDGYVSGINRGDNYKFCLDGQRLVEIADSEYRTETESYSRIKKHGGSAQAPDYWTVELRDGRTITYGGANTYDSERDDEIGNPYLWGASRVEDLAGNAMSYSYQKDSLNGIHRIQSISYTQNGGVNLNHSVEFDYGTTERPDMLRRYMAGNLENEDKRLERITVKADGVRVRSYEMHYQSTGNVYAGASYDDPVQTSRLASIQLCYTSTTDCAIPIVFDWTTATLSQYRADTQNEYQWTLDDINPAYYAEGGIDLTTPWANESSEPGYRLTRYNSVRGDFDGDNLKEIAWWDCGLPSENNCVHKVKMGDLDPVQTIDSSPEQISWTAWDILPGSSLGQPRKDRFKGGVLDFNGDGLDDYYIGSDYDRQGLKVYLSDGQQLNYSASYSIPAAKLTTWLTLNVGNASYQDYWGWYFVLKDLNGDGLVDVLKTIAVNEDPLVISRQDAGETGIYVAVNNGNGFDAFTRWGTMTDYQTSMKVDARDTKALKYTVPQLADVNGDGMPDILGYLPGVGLEVGLNTGNGFEHRTDWSWGVVPGLPVFSFPGYDCNQGDSYGFSDRYLSRVFRYGDFNADGKADIAFVQDDGLYVSMSTGLKFEQPMRWSTALTLRKLTCGSKYQEDGDVISVWERHNWTVKDANRDGRSDVFIEITRTDEDPTEYSIYGALYSLSLPDNLDQGFTQLQELYRKEYDYLNTPDQISYTGLRVSEDGAPLFIDGYKYPHLDYIQEWQTYTSAPESPKILKVNEGTSRSIDLSYKYINHNPSIYTQEYESGSIFLGRNRSSSLIVSSFDNEPLTTKRDHTKPTTQQGRFAVEAITVNTHGAQQLTKSYHYRNQRIHPAGFGDLGFAEVEETTTYAGEADRIRSVSEYHQAVDPQFRLAGYLKQQIRCVVDHNDIGCEGTARVLSETKNSWKVRVYSDDIDSDIDSPHFFPYITSSSIRTWDLNGAAIANKRFRSYSATETSCAPVADGTKEAIYTASAGGVDDVNYDQDGVLLLSSTITCDSRGDQGAQSVVREDVVQSEINSVKSATRWVVGQIGKREHTSWIGSDWESLNSPQTRTWSYTYHTNGPHQGRLLSETIEPDSATLRFTQEYTYNNYGSVATMTEYWNNLADDGLNFSTRLTTVNETFDAESNRLVTTLNAMSHSETTKYEAVFGLPVEYINANSLSTVNSYDRLGRIISIQYPDNTTSTIDYITCNSCFSYNSKAAWFSHLKRTGESAARTYFDGLGREVGTRDKGLNGDYIYTFRDYNDRGNLIKTVDPFYSGGWHHETQYSYDVLDRIKLIAFADGSSQIVNYNGLQQTTINRLSQESHQYLNGVGWVMQSVDSVGTPVDFSYYPFGELKSTKVNNDNGTLVSIQYDNLGRKIQLDDPNTGVINYTYNSLGLTATETDAKGQVTQYHYDKLGRRINRIDDAQSSGASQRTHTWLYDNKPYGKGLLGRLTGYNTDGTSFSEEYAYTSLSLLQSTTTDFGGDSYQTTLYYDNFSRLVGTTYPTGYVAANFYNSYGYLSQIVAAGSGSLLWEANTADARGNVTQYTLGNGVVTNQTYEDNTGRIDTIRTQKNTAVIQDHGYQFDSLGNLTERRDFKNNLTQSFCYDDLNRLTATRFNGCSAATVDFSYDSLGNILSKDGVSGVYQYGGLGAGPNAVTTANNLTYHYDLNGNLELAKTSGGQTVKTVAYSAFNKPTRMESGNSWTEMVYGPHRSRVSRSDSNGRTTRYIGGLYEETNDGTKVEKVHYLGDFALYVMESGATNDNYHLFLHRDHIGSIIARSRDNSGSIEYLGYNAWGTRLLENWGGPEEGSGFSPEASSRGFTDHEHLDGVGLVHMNGRVFDPEIGRFLSPDPYIQSPYDSQSHNRYSYVFNNPLSFVDPSGYVCSQSFEIESRDDCSQDGVNWWPFLGGRDLWNLPSTPWVNPGREWVFTFKGYENIPSLSGTNLGSVDVGAGVDASLGAIERLSTDLLYTLTNAHEIYYSIATLALIGELPSALLDGVLTEGGAAIDAATNYDARAFGSHSAGVIGALLLRRGGATRGVDPNTIRYSQNSVNGTGALVQSMKANGWQGDPIDVVRMGDGGLTTIDNTRVLAASRAGIEVQANIRNASDVLPENMVERFTTKKGVPSTWGEAVQLRIGKQNAAFRSQYPNGSPYTGSLD